MNKAVVFDLDGVLIDSREAHFDSLNKALSDISYNFVISKTEQEQTFEGLTTRSKLDILSLTKGLPKTFHEIIWKNKQIYSSEIFLRMPIDEELVEIFLMLKGLGFKIGVASNAIRHTLDACLKAIGVINLIDFSLSNEDVAEPKPSPEIYLSMMTVLGSDQKTTIIFEDSEVGKKAATSSGAKMFPVESRADISLKSILSAVDYIEG